MGKDKKNKTIFVCSECGGQALKWLGRCPDCGAWNSMLEEKIQNSSTSNYRHDKILVPQSIDDINPDPELRICTGISEFDRVLGGGLVAGSMVLIGGDPGIGKSTLMLQVFHCLALKGIKTLYISGEESAQQIKLRASRIDIKKGTDIYILTATCVEEIMEYIKEISPVVLAVDSIQTIYTENAVSAPGSVSQVRESAAIFMNFAKTAGVPVFLIGHVTKDGSIAGPKVLEHLVDTVLYFEGDRGQVYRVLRTVKNRFGSTNEIGVFEMKDSGLHEIENPSRFFLEERPVGSAGSVVVPCIEGTRPMMVEIQALVGQSSLGMPRRVSVGIDPTRISLLVAVISKQLGIDLGNHDIFVKVAGGLKVDEPATDLGTAVGIVSSFFNMPVDPALAIFGEVGLAGEVRGVSQPLIRVEESERMGFTRCVLSKKGIDLAEKKGSQIKFEGVSSLKETVLLLFPKKK